MKAHIKKLNKQDYELKTSYRLLKEFKEWFTKLLIIIRGYALYLGRPF